MICFTDVPDLLMELTNSRAHLPNMGLMLMFWNKYVSGAHPVLQPIPLDGADLTIDSSASSLYPMTEMNITLGKSRKQSFGYYNICLEIATHNCIVKLSTLCRAK